MSEPLPVIPLEYAKPADERSPAWRRVNRITLVAGAVAAAGGWAAVLFEVESVLISGPALLAIGVLMVIGGLRRQRPWVWGIGLAHCGVCVLFVALVNLLHWSPREAERPFAVMGGPITC